MSKSDRVTSIELTDKEIEYLSSCVYWDYLKAEFELNNMDSLEQCGYQLPTGKTLAKRKEFYVNLYRKLGGEK